MKLAKVRVDELLEILRWSVQPDDISECELTFRLYYQALAEKLKQEGTDHMFVIEDYFLNCLQEYHQTVKKAKRANNPNIVHLHK